MRTLAWFRVEGGGSSSAGPLHTASTARYLADRFEFEYRWDAALRSAQRPERAAGGAHQETVPALTIALLWGDSDAVSPLAIPLAVSREAAGCQLSVLRGVGHFLMLEAPDRWTEEVVTFARQCIREL
jgi:pimeloyl-ACP methyl ester carboxylesterase